jgi:hypothetical protein
VADLPEWVRHKALAPTKEQDVHDALDAAHDLGGLRAVQELMDASESTALLSPKDADWNWAEAVRMARVSWVVNRVQRIIAEAVKPMAAYIAASPITSPASGRDVGALRAEAERMVYTHVHGTALGAMLRSAGYRLEGLNVRQDPMYHR